MNDHITRCPFCDTSFRVTDEQISTARGMVRCGSCLQVFSAPDYFQEPGSVAETASDAGVNLYLYDDEQTSGLSGFEDNTTPQAVEPEISESGLAEAEVTGADTIDTGTIDTEVADADGNEAHTTEVQDPAAHTSERGSAEDEAAEEKNIEAWRNQTEVAELHTSESESEVPDSQEPENSYSETTYSETTGSETTDSETTYSETTERAGPALLEASEVIQRKEDASGSDHESEAINTDEVDSQYVAEQDQAEPVSHDEDELIPVVLDHLELKPDDPELIVGELVDPQKRSSWLWLSGSTLLLLALCVQFGFFNRNLLVQHADYRGWYEAVCRYASCALPVYRNYEEIETVKLLVRSHPHEPGALAVDAVLRNTAAYRQTFPRIALSFSDINSHVVARRIFTPQEYLAGEMTGMKYFPAFTEVRISLEILDPGQSAVGYTLLAVKDS